MDRIPMLSCGQPTVRDQSPPTPLQTAEEEPNKQLPWCLRSSKRNAAPAMETEDIQATPTENPDNTQIIDSERRVLQPGDCVEVGSLCTSLYYGLYIGNLDVIYCEEKTQMVMMEKLDVSRQFLRRIPNSKGQYKIFPAEKRIDRARSCIEKVSPVRERKFGLDFVYWICSGLDRMQAKKNGLILWFG